MSIFNIISWRTPGYSPFNFHGLFFMDEISVKLLCLAGYAIVCNIHQKKILLLSNAKRSQLNCFVNMKIAVA